jgi:hypothetical protein
MTINGHLSSQLLEEQNLKAGSIIYFHSKTFVAKEFD